MKAAAAVVPLVVGVLSALQLLRALLPGRLREVPPGLADGVMVVHLDTEPVVLPSASDLRRRWRREALLFVASLAWLSLIVLVVPVTPPVLAAAYLAEAGLFVMITAYRVVMHRDRKAGVAIDQCVVTVHATGSPDALAARLRRTFLAMRAFGVVGSTVAVTDDRIVIEGGTGMWGGDRDAGYCLRATAVRAEDRWEVRIESRNYVPSLVQDLRNARNVATVERALLA